jgi:hypothetical protein
MSSTRSSESKDLTPNAFSFDANGNLVISKEHLDPDMLAKLQAAKAASEQPANGPEAPAPQIIGVSISQVID